MLTLIVVALFALLGQGLPWANQSVSTASPAANRSSSDNVTASHPGGFLHQAGGPPGSIPPNWESADRLPDNYNCWTGHEYNQIPPRAGPRREDKGRQPNIYHASDIWAAFHTGVHFADLQRMIAPSPEQNAEMGRGNWNGALLPVRFDPLDHGIPIVPVGMGTLNPRVYDNPANGYSHPYAFPLLLQGPWDDWYGESVGTEWVLFQYHRGRPLYLGVVSNFYLYSDDRMTTDRNGQPAFRFFWCHVLGPNNNPDRGAELSGRFPGVDTSRTWKYKSGISSHPDRGGAYLYGEVDSGPGSGKPPGPPGPGPGDGGAGAGAPNKPHWPVLFPDSGHYRIEL